MKRFLFIFAICMVFMHVFCQDTVRVGNLNYIIETTDQTADVGKNTGAEGVVTMPATITYKGETYDVTEIGKEAFSYPVIHPWQITKNEKLKSVFLPESIMIIGENAFAFCTNLQTIKIPDSVVIIEKGAFFYTSLRSIIWGTNLKSIGASAFAGTNLQKVIIPNTVLGLGEGAFMNCSKLESVTTAGGIREIPKKAFMGCHVLKTVKIFRAKTIESYAFFNCFALTNVTLPQTLQTIKNSSFVCCNGMISLTIPANVKTIEDYTFQSCKNLEYLMYNSCEIPYSDNMLSGCSKFKGVKYQQ